MAPRFLPHPNLFWKKFPENWRVTVDHKMATISAADSSRKRKNGGFENIQKVKVGKTNILSSAALPILALKQSIIDSVKAHDTTIVVGETGSGKSTQLTQYLRNLFPAKCVVCTQPRRVAAVTIAQRVAQEQGVKLGDEVGYCVRFDDKSSSKTRIKYVTDGVLLRECMSDPNLSAYSIVILDEAHERSLQTDILMGLLKRVQIERNSKNDTLRIIVMSATLQVELFTNFFQNSSVIRIPGREYPVEINYIKNPEKDYIDSAMMKCLQIHRYEDPGGVLVFLPGQDDIETLTNLLEEKLNDVKECRVSVKGVIKNYDVIPLYAAMSPDEQLKAFIPPIDGVRKYVLATNIAETSVTISGIKYVIDVGFVKTRMIQPTTGLDMLKIIPVSQSQANQRAGRAGREQAGKCYRLYTSESYNKLSIASLPEIQRVNISQVILQLKVLGITNPFEFDYVDPPSMIAMKKALEILYALGAIEKDQTLSPHGHKMAKLPLDPIFANLLLHSIRFGCIAEILTAVSLLSTDNIFIIPHREEEKKFASHSHRRFASKDGDLPTLVSIYDAWISAKQDHNWTSRNYLSYRALKNRY